METKATRAQQFFNASIMTLSMLVNSFLTTAFVTISSEVSTYIPDSTQELVSLSAFVCNLVHPFIAFVQIYILNKYSIKVGISINAIMMIVACFLRLLILHSFWWVIISSFIAAFFNGFLISSTSRFSAIWFIPSQRVIMTSILVFSSVTSGGIGSFISPLIVHPNLTIEEGQRQVFHLVTLHIFIVGGIMLINLLLLRANPFSKNPFNLQIRSIIDHQGTILKGKPFDGAKYLYQVRKLLKSKGFILIFICFTFSNSCVTNIVVNIEIFIKNFGMDPKDAGLSNLLAVIFGLLGCIIISTYGNYDLMTVKKTKKFKKIGVILLTSCLISLFLLFIAGLIYNIGYLYWTGVIVFGISSIPIFPILIEYCCEFMYPIGQATITGVIHTVPDFFSFFIGMGTTAILSNQTKNSCYIVMGIFFTSFTITLFLLSLTNERLRRMQQQQKLIKKSINSQQNIEESQNSVEDHLIVDQNKINE